MVSAEGDNLAPCSRAEECRAWGQGLVQVTLNKGEELEARTIWTATGCEVCPGPAMTQGDIGVIKSQTVEIQTTPEVAEAELIRGAEIAIALAVEALPSHATEYPAELGFRTT